MNPSLAGDPVRVIVGLMQHAPANSSTTTTTARRSFRLIVTRTLVACVAAALSLASISAAKVGASRPAVENATNIARPSDNANAARSSKTFKRLAAPTSVSGKPVNLVHDVAAQDAIVPAGSATREIWMEVTAYCPCTKCCGPQAMGLTASGKDVTYNDGRFVAADTTRLPFGTRLVVPGYGDGSPVEVIDRGGAIKGNKLDLFFPTHQEALEWGRKWVSVTVLE